MRQRLELGRATRLAVITAALATAGAAAACRDRRPPRFVTAATLPSASRHPDGIAVDPVSAPPAPTARGATSSGVLALREPPSTRAARRTIEQFFTAVAAEDIGGLVRVLLPAATNVDPAGSGTARNLVNLWRERFRKRDYDKLAGRTVYRPAELSIFRGEQLAKARAGTAQRASVTAAAQAADLVVRVPVVSRAVSGERLLGDDIVFWLRPVGAEYRVVRTAEHVPY